MTRRKAIDYRKPKSKLIVHLGANKPYVGKEDDFQVSTKQIIDLSYSKILAWHTPNGGSRHKIEAAKLKRMGVLRGVSDWVIWEKRRGYNGLAIELKVKGGNLRQSQESFLMDCMDRNIKAVVCWNIDPFRDLLKWYFER